MDGVSAELDRWEGQLQIRHRSGRYLQCVVVVAQLLALRTDRVRHCLQSVALLLNGIEVGARCLYRLRGTLPLHLCTMTPEKSHSAQEYSKQTSEIVDDFSVQPIKVFQPAKDRCDTVTPTCWGQHRDGWSDMANIPSNIHTSARDAG